MIELQVKEREIETLNKVDLIRGSKNYFKCKISFDEFWKDFEKTVVFKCGYSNSPFMVYVKDMASEVIIPSEVLKESGIIKIGVFGISEDTTLPTLWSEDFDVLQGSDTSGEIPKPSENIYESILKELKSKQEKLISGSNIKTVNGESILGGGDISVHGVVDLNGYVKNTDYATASGNGGIVKVTATNGISINDNGVLYVNPAYSSDIAKKSSQRLPIVPAMLDYAIKVGMTTNRETWTEEEKQSARDLIGITEMIGDIETLLGGI